MTTFAHEPLIIGAALIILSLVLALLLAARKAHLKDIVGARCLRFALLCGSEAMFIRLLRETPREEWGGLARGFGVSLNWGGHLQLGDNACVLLSEEHYQSVGLLIAMALLSQTSTPYSPGKQSRLSAQYSKVLRQARVKEQGLTSIEESLRKFLPTWQIKVAPPPPS